MKRDQAPQLLAQALAELVPARRHLDYSVSAFRFLLSAFRPTVDLLVNKVLRSLDRVELKPEGTLLDVVNGAEKRGFIKRAGDLRELKDVRNIIAHDYAGARAAEVFAYCREQKPVLDAVCVQAAGYAGNILSLEN